jgi:hypothetical protein
VPTLSTPMPQTPQEAALTYVRLGMAILPTAPSKRPLTSCGLKDATRDPTTIAAWWSRWPNADPAWALPGSVVVIDLDVGPGANGYRDFERLAGYPAAEFRSPAATTPSGGLHLYCRTNGRTFRNAVRVAGASIDVRSHGGYSILPSPGSGRRWLEGKPYDLAPVPDWLVAVVTPPALRAPARLFDKPPASPSRFTYDGPPSCYGAATLRSIVTAIKDAPNGSQENVLSWGGVKVGMLINARELPAAAAHEVIAAGLSMPSYDPSRPWTPREVEAKILRSVERGRGQTQASRA